jgi:rhodanese-related sulfurtransferase
VQRGLADVKLQKMVFYRIVAARFRVFKTENLSWVMEFIKQNIFLVVLAVVSGGMLLAELLRGGRGGGLSPVEATMLINRENAIVVDVREAAEFATGHIPNARNIPLGELEKRIGELAKFKNKPIVLVCLSGMRSGRALATLTKAGFEKAQNLGGGIAGWRKNGHPLIKS